MPIAVWSPGAVAAMALFFSFGGGMALAIQNWRALGTRRRILPHVVAGVVIVLLMALAQRQGLERLDRAVSIASAVAGYAYFRIRMSHDIAAVRDRKPAPVMTVRRWYAGIPWALLGSLVVVALIVIAFLIFDVATLVEED